MRATIVCFLVCGLVVTLLPAPTAFAGPYTDDLSRCVVELTTPEDRADLVRWMFAAMSLHPAVKSIAAVTPEQLDAANKQTAGLFMKVLTESCREKAAKANTYEGPAAIETSFRLLGQVAMKELFSSPEVAAGMAALEKYADAEKLKSALTLK